VRVCARIQCASKRRQTRVYCVPRGDSGSRQVTDVAVPDCVPRDVAAPGPRPRDASAPEHTLGLVKAGEDKVTAFTHTLSLSLKPPPPPHTYTHQLSRFRLSLSRMCVGRGRGGGHGERTTVVCYLIWRGGRSRNTACGEAERTTFACLIWGGGIANLFCLCSY
jgi:hypothetical protein